MLVAIYQKRFEKDVRKAKKRSNDMDKLKNIILKILEGESLPEKNRNHKLKGKFEGYWECHIEPDWLLIYKKTSETIIFVRTGTHTDLFR
ncbi:type II toxin-antitoxin system YafQ family toxin [Candidatus Dependentiae bacterium]